MSDPAQGNQRPADPSDPRYAGYPYASGPNPADLRPLAWPGDGPAKPQPRGHLGLTGMIIVIVALVIGVVLAVFGAGAINDMVRTYGDKLSQMENAPQNSPVFRRFAGLFMGYLASCVLGIIGWIVCIVGAVKHSARRAAIAGIILGIVAVPIAFAIMSMLIRGVSA